MMQDDQPTPMEAPVGDLIDAGDRFRARAETEGALARAAAHAQPETPPSASAPPMRPEGQQVEPYVVEGEIVTAEAASTEGRPRRMLPAVRVDRDQARQVAAIAGRAVLRAGWQVGQGHLVWLRRLIGALTYATYREQIRAARARGDAEALAEWMERYKEAKQARWERILRAPQVIVSALVAALLVVVILAGMLLVIGVTVHLWEGGWTWSEWWATVGAGLSTAAWLAQAALIIGLMAAPVGWALAAYRAGRTADVPRWLLAPGAPEVSTWLDEGVITRALEHLGIAPLTKAIRDGQGLVYTVPARVDGAGTSCQIRLPLGVAAADVVERRERLAANLGRAVLETWPTVGDEAGILDLWVADKGALGTDPGPWPLAEDGTCDLWAGVPIGRSQRGQVITAPVIETNWLIGGRPGQGKSAALRVLLLGAALDPTAELWVHVMGESPDFEPFRPRLARYVMGLDDAAAEATLQSLRDALAEMERRGQVLGQLPGRPPKTSRRLANKAGLGLHPLLLVIDECHELFMHREYGREAADLAVRLIKRGRKYGVILLLATQSPTAESIPRDVTRNVSCGVAFSVADHVANDGLLGSGRYRAGIRATDLRPGVDRGTSVAVGITDQPFELVRWFYVPFEDGRDEVTPIVRRAMAALQQADLTPARTSPADEPRDLLADVAEVLGEDEVRAAQVPALLAKRWPRHRPYQQLTGKSLVAQLADLGVKVPSTGNTWPVRPDAIRQALARRRAETEAPDAAEGE